MKTILYLLFFIPLKILACDCNDPQYTVKESLEKCDVIFIGKFKGWQASKDSIIHANGQVEHFIDAIFEIKKYYKKGHDSTYIVTTELSDCGMQFLKDTTYIVYGVKVNSHKHPYVHHCYKYCVELNTKFGQADKKELEILTTK